MQMGHIYKYVKSKQNKQIFCILKHLWNQCNVNIPNDLFVSKITMVI